MTEARRIGARPRVPTKKISAPVEGIHCAACVRRVENALASLEGVEEATVNLSSRVASFRVVGEVDPDEVERIVGEAGYEIDAAALRGERSAPGARPDEHDKYRRRFLAALVLALPVFLFEMLSMWYDVAGWIGVERHKLEIVAMGLASALLAIPGREFFVLAAKNLRRLVLDMNTLVALGAGSAYAYSVVATLAPRWVAVGSETPTPYFDTAVTIVALILLGRTVESRARKRTGDELRKLLAMKPETARRVVDSGLEEISADELRVGDRAIVRPGDRVPSDGEVVEGVGVVDESTVTGESSPVTKRVGDEVAGGTLNADGSFTYVVSRLAEESSIARVARMVEEAQGSKPPIQKTADKISSIFTPVVVGVAVATFASWAWFGGEEAFRTALVNAVAVLIVACPCALGLAAPAAIAVSTGRAALEGMLFKDAETFERSQNVGTIVFDKTGTLTEGKPRVVRVETFDGDANTALGLVAAVERRSEHPVAKAVVDYAEREEAPVFECVDFHNEPGAGAAGTVEGSLVLVGARAYLEGEGVEIPTSDEGAIGEAYAAIDGKLAARFEIADEIRASAKPALEELAELGLRVVMLTGDRREVAERVAKELGIDETIAEVKPDGKVEAIKRLRANSDAPVAMVGD
ncbi:MAG: heavy metal translocating P-type ATPase, partial [Ignavibacteriales bacterium]|nr:heavy metal translocating P-type ATPase [Ignavibacteriales bacterium]